MNFTCGLARARDAVRHRQKEVLEDLVEKAANDPLHTVGLLRTEADHRHVGEIRESSLVEIFDAVGNDYRAVTLLRNQDLAPAPLT